MNRKKGRDDAKSETHSASVARPRVTSASNRRAARSRGRGRTLLDRLLSELNQYPDRVSNITERVREALERRVSMLVLDMAGFSRLTLQYGIIHYLAMIRQMAEAATPAVLGNGGRVIKQDADNLFAIFDNPTRALEGAVDTFRAFDAVNTVTPAERHIYGSVGIGWGDTLVVDDEDLFGSEMNLASKLGEDLAGKSEILLTASAYEALAPDRFVFTPLTFSIREMEIPCYRYERSLFNKSGGVTAGTIKADAMD